jgi:putative tricarboxylic transport membrane protein
VLIGVFAFAQIMTELERGAGPQRAAALARAANLTVSHLKVLWEILSRPFLLLWTSFIGVLIGVLPAIGGSAASMMAYDQAKKLSSHPERFGTGTPEGIIASESSNNANVGGSLVTIMAFGIPGDAVTAVMLGALTIHGIQSGPLFISQNSQLAYGMFAAYLVAHPIMVAVLWVGSRWMLRVTTVPQAVLFPVVLVLCVIGAYALNNTMGNVYILLSFGVLGYAMVKFGFPLAPFILGVILGDQIEINLIRAIMSDPNPWLFLTRPISGLLIAGSVASVAFALWQHRRQQRRLAQQSGDGDADF